MATLYVYVIKSATGNYLGQGGSILEFGIQFFPSIGPDQKSAAQYWSEALKLTQLAEQLGYANVRTVEHYFHPYGGYSPDPLIFLSAAAAIHDAACD